MVRSALFPLVLVVLLVYLASQTLLSNDDGGDAGERRYSDVKTLLRESATQVELATFDPPDRRIELRLDDGRELRASYPSDESAFALEQLLDAARVPHDAESSRESAWWSFATYILPFVLFFAFWIFLMQRMQRPLPERPHEP